MGLHQEQMDSIKVDSYKDCVWYVPEIDRCKLPGICGERHSKCGYKEGKLNDVCIWVTKFLKSAPKDVELDMKMSNDLADRYGFYVMDDNSYDESFLNKLAKIFNSGN